MTENIVYKHLLINLCINMYKDVLNACKTQAEIMYLAVN